MRKPNKLLINETTLNETTLAASCTFLHTQVISPEVARAKGVCQCCLMDMEFNLPVGVRDALLKGSAEEQALIPQSGVNQTWHYDQVRLKIHKHPPANSPTFTPHTHIHIHAHTHTYTCMPNLTRRANNDINNNDEK